MRRGLGWIVAMVMTVAVASPSWAQMDSREGIALQNQILELRRDVQVLRDQLSRGGGGSSLGGGRPVPLSGPSGGGSDIVANLLSRVDRLDDEMRSLRGRLDEIDNVARRQGEDLSKQIADLAFRLDNGGGGRPAGSSPPPANLGGNLPPLPQSGGPPAGGTPGRRTPELAMQEGSAALARRDYAAAEAAAREVLAVPRTPRAIDAQFLLAQALVGKKDLAGAAVAYDDSYNRARTGPHAADSLLGLANSLTSLGEKRAACATLDKMRGEFPTPRQDLRDPIAGARQRAGCR